MLRKQRRKAAKKRRISFRRNKKGQSKPDLYCRHSQDSRFFFRNSPPCFVSPRKRHICILPRFIAPSVASNVFVSENFRTFPSDSCTRVPGVNASQQPPPPSLSPLAFLRPYLSSTEATEPRRRPHRRTTFCSVPLPRPPCACDAYPAGATRV